MKKIFKLLFAGALAFTIAPALVVAFNQDKEVTSVQATEPVATADQVKYQDGDTVKTFEELPTGYTFENGVLTVTSTSTADYSIWVEDTNAGNLTIVFERDYGSNQIYFEVKTSYKFILTSSNSINVTLAALNANGLTLSGNLNLNIVGLDYVVLTNSFDSLLSASHFCLLDNASFYCVDPIWADADNGKYLVHIHSFLQINTTGRFVAGFIDDPISGSNPAYSFRCAATPTLFEFIRCDGNFVLYNKSSNRLYLISDEINLSALYQFSVKSRDIDHNKFYYCATMKPYNVFYDANGGSGEMDFYGGAKGNITLLECSFTAPTGKQFKCWAENSTSGTQYAAGATYSVTNDAVMYAIWEDAPDALTGTVSITGSLKYDETLTAVVTNTNNTGTLSYQWRRNGEDIASATSSTYKVVVADIGYTLSVKVGSSVETGFIVGTASSQITKADGPNTPKGISSTDCTDEYNDNGVISGITTEMEYKLSTSSTWISGDGKDITELKPGTYEVRFKETETHEAGKIKNVVIKAYNQPVPPVPSSSGLSGGAIVGITIASVLVVEVAVFAIFWFVIKKKTWADFVALFKKK